MLEKATRWHKANNLRTYIDAIETKQLNANNSEELKRMVGMGKGKRRLV